jgi:hypothetical protein
LSIWIRALRKVLTRPVWWRERNRRYPIRARFSRLAAIPVRQAPRLLAVLCTPQTLQDALWSAWSWYRFLHEREFELRIFIDGSVPENAAAAARARFPGVRILGVADAVSDLLKSSPALAAFFRGHPLGKKLVLILALSRQCSFLYSDHDVLAFNPPVELLANIDAGVPSFMEEEHEGNLDAILRERCRALGLEHFSKFNSGLLFVPRGVLSPQLAEEVLSTWRPPAVSWFTEQTVLNVLLRRASAIALPRERYVISARRQFYFEQDVDYQKIVARHFTGTVRHVMYKFGMPILLDQNKNLAREPGNA